MNKKYKKTTQEYIGNVFDRVPPQALDVERAVLGSMMANRSYLESVMPLIENEGFFYATANRKIFETIRDINNTGNQVDILSVVEKLRKKEWLEDVGTEVYLSELIDSASLINNVSYIKILKEKHIKREWIRISQETMQKAFEPDSTVEDLESEHDKSIMNLNSNEADRGAFFKDIAHGYLENIENIRTGKISIVNSGFKNVDSAIGGLWGGDLVVIGARPGMGKSAFLGCMCKRAWDLYKKPSLIFSLEMTKSAWFNRALSSSTGINNRRLRTGDIRKNELESYHRSFSDVAETGIYVDDRPYLNVYQIRSEAIRLQRKYDFGFIGIDYLQKIRDTGKFDSKRLETGEKSFVLKALAKELNIPVIPLAQLNRSLESRANKRPIMSDLKETSDIEQDADLIAFLYRPEKYGESEDETECEFIIAKQREGDTGTVKLKFYGPTTTFSEGESNVF